MPRADGRARSRRWPCSAPTSSRSSNTSRSSRGGSSAAAPGPAADHAARRRDRVRRPPRLHARRRLPLPRLEPLRPPRRAAAEAVPGGGRPARLLPPRLLAEHGVRRRRSKFDFARQVTAALAYIALADLDRVAVVAFAGDIVADFPLTRGKDRILSLLKFLEDLPPQGEVDRPGPGRARGSSTASSAGGWSSSSATSTTRPGSSAGSTSSATTATSRTSSRSSTAARPTPNLLGDLELFDVETGSVQKVTVTERNLRQYRADLRPVPGVGPDLLQHLRPGLHADLDRGPVRRADPQDDADRRGGA